MAKNQLLPMRIASSRGAPVDNDIFGRSNASSIQYTRDTQYPNSSFPTAPQPPNAVPSWSSNNENNIKKLPNNLQNNIKKHKIAKQLKKALSLRQKGINKRVKKIGNKWKSKASAKLKKKKRNSFMKSGIKQWKAKAKASAKAKESAKDKAELRKRVSASKKARELPGDNWKLVRTGKKGKHNDPSAVRFTPSKNSPHHSRVRTKKYTKTQAENADKKWKEKQKKIERSKAKEKAHKKAHSEGKTSLKVHTPPSGKRRKKKLSHFTDWNTNDYNSHNDEMTYSRPDPNSLMPWPFKPKQSAKYTKMRDLSRGQGYGLNNNNAYEDIPAPAPVEESESEDESPPAGPAGPVPVGAAGPAGPVSVGPVSVGPVSVGAAAGTPTNRCPKGKSYCDGSTEFGKKIKKLRCIPTKLLEEGGCDKTWEVHNLEMGGRRWTKSTCKPNGTGGVCGN